MPGKVSGESGDGRAAAIVAELEPSEWRGLTGPMLARRAVGAVDHHGVLMLVAQLPGTDVGPLHPVQTAERNDPRVDALVRVLDLRRWRSSSLHGLCDDLVVALDAWLVGHLSSGRGPVDR
ncbi:MULTISPECIES: hypothetical protein [unclassified Blastococcus]